MTTRKRKTFDPSLKLEVVRMIKEQGLSVQHVSQTMDIGPTAIRRWLEQYGAEQNGQPGIGKPLSLEQQLATAGVRVHCLALGGADLTSAASKMTMGVLVAVAEFERDLLIERTQAGVARARAEGKLPGRPPALTRTQQAEAMERLTLGCESVTKLARDYGTSHQSIMRVRERLAKSGVGGS